MKQELNEYQRAAVLDEHEACLVNANVGSGKTTVLIEKIHYLHTEKGIPYERMVVLTFTNKAADEIRQRLIESDQRVLEGELEHFGTFHSTALLLLKRWMGIGQLGYTPDFTVMEPEEEYELALRLVEEHQLKIKYQNRLRARLDQVMELSEEERQTKVSRYKDDIMILGTLLVQEKRKQDVMTFSDLLKNVILMFSLMTAEERQAVTPEWIIIDEVQDCDARQIDMIQSLHGEKTRIFAVGDPNQVIYSWRGSALNVFFKLRKEFSAVELSLPVNYRSSNAILSAAKRFQQNGSELIGSRGEGCPIVIRRHYNPFQEAGYLADRIREQHDAGIPYGEIAIFYRLTDQAEVLEKVLVREEIPCEVHVRKPASEELEAEQQRAEEQDAVQLMTLHASKGLEFSQVYIIGVNYGLIPLRTKNMEEDEEERRLFYVGMTRARNRLELSYYTSPDHYGVTPGESRYLRLLPKEFVERTDEQEEKSVTDLHELKRQVIAERQRRQDSLTGEDREEAAQYQQAGQYQEQETAQHQQEETESGRRVRHPKYGEGVVIAEDEQMVTVDFGPVGQKEFLCAFSQLEPI